MVATATFCSRCGAALPPGAEFCPKCGAAVDVAPAPPPVAAAPPPALHPDPPRAPVVTAPPRDRMRLVWMIGIPVSIAILGIVVFALLRGMPFSSDSDRARTAEAPQFDTIGESDARGDDPGLVETAPPVVATVPPPPAPVIEPLTPDPPVVTTATPPSEISEQEAVNILRGFVASRDTYGIEPQCIAIDSDGYRNAGYTLTVVDRCNDRRQLGRWRVDSKTREVFRQSDDGRFLRP